MLVVSMHRYKSPCLLSCGHWYHLFSADFANWYFSHIYSFHFGSYYYIVCIYLILSIFMDKVLNSTVAPRFGPVITNRGALWIMTIYFWFGYHKRFTVIHCWCICEVWKGFCTVVVILLIFCHHLCAHGCWLHG